MKKDKFKQSTERAILENRTFLNEQIQQDKEYTKDEAKSILKKLIKKIYDSTYETSDKK